MDEQRLIPLAALQHYAFCPRQCALIHIEQVWAENWLTAQGQLLHQRVDDGEPETRKGIRYERGVAVSAPLLGLTGKLDLLEVNTQTRQCLPVEYKRGKPKITNVDRIQLCAQALCLEEMLGQVIEHGALWYGQTRHRELVCLDAQLRQQTLDTISQVRQLFDGNITPKAIYAKNCKACSLIDLCNPQIMVRDASRDYINKLFDGGEFSDEEAAK